MDEALWYETNPSLGVILKERTIRSENVRNTLDFVIQRLGYWHSYELKSEITEKEWQSMKVARLPELTGKIFAGIKFGANGANVSLSIAIKAGEKIFLESIGCKPQANGLEWLVSFVSKADVYAVVIDGKGKTELLSEALKTARVKAKVIVPTANDAVNAYAAFRQAVDDGTICHKGQPGVVQAVSNCERRLIGNNGAFGFRSIKNNADVSLVESLAFAYWARATMTEKRKQKIGY